MTGVAFYGHFTGESSYPVVCRAILQELAERVGEVLVCDFRDSDSSDLAMAVRQHADRLEQSIMRSDIPPPPRVPDEVAALPALVFGFPPWLLSVPEHARVIGYHVGDVRPVPAVWPAAINHRCHEVVVPSEWMAETLRQADVEKPITVVHHGLDPAIFYLGERRRHRGIVARHFSSAYGGRKGTSELIRALGLARSIVGGGGLPAGLKVYLHVQPETAIEMASEAARAGLPEETLTIVPERSFRGQAELADLLRSDTDLLLAPSRAEGFGMIPLEAVACGVPVVMTGCTGHADYIGDIRAAVLEVPTGVPTVCEPFPGHAPSLDAHDLCGCVVEALEHLDELTENARETSAVVRSHWSWNSVLTPLVEMFKVGE